MDDPIEEQQDELTVESEQEASEEIPYTPFHFLNEFMNHTYRETVVRSTLQALPGLPEERRRPVEAIIRRLVKAPGFRNSAKAPTAVKVRPTAEVFEKNPELVKAIVAAWAEAHPALRQRVFDLLVERGWDVLSPEADRTQLPGFRITWPTGEDFETLNAAYTEKYPQETDPSDDVSLMAVWLSGRLPYQVEAE